jgi:hypothetical protein
MNKATQEIFHFAKQVDNLKDFILKRKLSNELLRMIFSNNEVNALVLYYSFINATGMDAFKMEIETIDNLIKPYSEYNAERLKAMTSILQSEIVFTNIFAFNTMIECFNNLEITANTVEPYSASQIAWTCANILGIWGSNVFSFTGDVLKYIKASLEWDSWKLPPVFLSFPKILDMYETDKLKIYTKIVSYMKDMTLKEIAELKNDKSAIKLFSKTPYLLNYMVKCSEESQELVNKIINTNEQIKNIFKG